MFALSYIFLCIGNVFSYVGISVLVDNWYSIGSLVLSAVWLITHSNSASDKFNKFTCSVSVWFGVYIPLISILLLLLTNSFATTS